MPWTRTEVTSGDKKLPHAQISALNPTQEFLAPNEKCDKLLHKLIILDCYILCFFVKYSPLYEIETTTNIKLAWSVKCVSMSSIQQI
jgi:hypothetical protein